MSLLEKLWSEMDRLIDLLMGGLIKESEEYKQALGRANGVAFSLATFMTPHFSTEKEIFVEAVRRKKARNAGDDDYTTVGLGSRRLERPLTSAR